MTPRGSAGPENGDRPRAEKDLMRKPTIRQLLVTGIVIQSMWLLSGHLTATRQVEMRLGSPLPFNLSSLSDVPSTLPPSGGRCTTAFLCSTTCPACRRLASQWADTNTLEQPIWLLPGTPEEIGRWVAETGLDADHVRRLDARRSVWGGRVSGRIWFTPLRVVLTEEMTLQDMWPSNSLLTDSEMTSICPPAL